LDEPFFIRAASVVGNYPTVKCKVGNYPKFFTSIQIPAAGEQDAQREQNCGTHARRAARPILKMYGQQVVKATWFVDQVKATNAWNISLLHLIQRSCQVPRSRHPVAPQKRQQLENDGELSQVSRTGTFSLVDKSSLVCDAPLLQGPLHLPDGSQANRRALVSRESFPDREYFIPTRVE
jgi:hypothetical protein